MRAKITELDVRLEDLRVRVDRLVAQAHLLYIIGDAAGDASGDVSVDSSIDSNVNLNAGDK